ncbi:MAG: hypothetical protein JKY42_10070 [Flavobacteriales bacterium]|nr:hypothetical protein [Flavobacteriales bacterium]
MKKILLSISFIFAATCFTQLNAQCKTFTKKLCMPLLKPYIHNGQMNNITLFPGEDASLVQTFYSGQNYRIQLCAQENLGDSVYFKIITEDGQLVYSTQNEDVLFWDFNVANTQNLKITVVVPDVKPVDEIEQNGCIAILVGFRD